MANYLPPENNWVRIPPLFAIAIEAYVQDPFSAHGTNWNLKTIDYSVVLLIKRESPFSLSATTHRMHIRVGHQVAQIALDGPATGLVQAHIRVADDNIAQAVHLRLPFGQLFHDVLS